MGYPDVSGMDRGVHGLMKILFLISSLETGGAERQLVTIAKGMRTRGHDVAIALFYAGGALEREAIEARIKLIDLKKTGRWDILPFLLRTHAAIREWGPDVIYSFLGVPNIVAAILKPFSPEYRLAFGVRCSDMSAIFTDTAARTANWLEIKASLLADTIVFNSETGLRYGTGKGFLRRNPSRSQMVLIQTDFAPLLRKALLFAMNGGCLIQTSLLE